MTVAEIIVYIFLLLGAALSYAAKKLTITGAITGALVGALIYKGAGYAGIGMLALFFISGSWATGWQRNKKLATGIIKKNEGRRTTGQVLANGGTAALLGAWIWHNPDYMHLMQIMMAGSLAAAIADTLSSELGMVYGKRFFNILTFKKDQRGLDGVISFEGTLIGIVGAALIALVYASDFGWGLPVCWIVLAGFIGNAVDSVLGATLERKGLIGNNLVNFLNTATGALVCYLLSL